MAVPPVRGRRVGPALRGVRRVLSIASVVITASLHTLDIHQTCRLRLGPEKKRCTTGEEEGEGRSACCPRWNEQETGFGLTPDLERAHAAHESTLGDAEHEDPPLGALHRAHLRRARSETSAFALPAYNRTPRAQLLRRTFRFSLVRKYFWVLWMLLMLPLSL